MMIILVIVFLVYLLDYIVIQCGSLSLPIFEVNIIALIGELEKNEIEEKMIKIQSNDYQNEIHELIEKLFPSCNYQNENV